MHNFITYFSVVFSCNNCFGFAFFQTVLDICSLLPKTNIGTLVVSIVTIICLIAAKEINAYLSKKIPVPIPVELIAVSMMHLYTSL